MDKISVIVPVYNVQDYLSECIESIINQTYKNLEIILIDDGSSDDSPKICDDFAKKDRRIKVIHKANAGVSSARNRGIMEATGRYIAFVDSDDWIERDMYEDLYNKLKATNSDCVRSLYYINDNIPAKEDIDKSLFVEQDIKDNYLYNMTFGMLGNKKKNVAVAFWTYLIKTSILKEKNIFFNDGMRIGEDYVFISNVLINCKRLAIVDKVLYHYRYREGSAVNAYKSRYIYDIILNNTCKTEIYKEKKYKNIILMSKKENFAHLVLNSCYGLNIRNYKKRKDEVKDIRKYLLKDELFKSNVKIKLCRKDFVYILLKKNLIDLILILGLLKNRLKCGGKNEKGKYYSTSL